MKHRLEINKNAEGSKLGIMFPVNEEGDISSGYRISGPKAWGGSQLIDFIEIESNDLVTYIKEYAPDVLRALTEGKL